MLVVFNSIPFPQVLFIYGYCDKRADLTDLQNVFRLDFVLQFALSFSSD